MGGFSSPNPFIRGFLVPEVNPPKAAFPATEVPVFETFSTDRGFLFVV